MDSAAFRVERQPCGNDGRGDPMSSASETGADRRPTVFLSYARDDRARVTPLVAALREAGVDVWWDDHIEGGQAFAAAIEAALVRSEAVIVVWSAASVRSDWVRDEAGRGRDRACLVAISLDGTDPPLGFGQYHAIDFSHWRERGDAPEIDRLLRALSVCAGGESPAPRAPKLRARGTSRRGVVAAGAVAAAGGAWFLAGRPGWEASGAAPKNSIAVLPFANLSNDPSQSYFSDGVAEELRATLSRNAGLSVVAPTSSNKFRDTKDDAAKIAAKLGVAFLLEGSVRRSGDVVRIAADLIDGSTGFSRWAQTFERQLTDIFKIQTEVANIVAEALSSRMGAAQAQAATAGATVDPGAYDSLLRGRALFNLGGDEATHKAALAQFDAAIAADPRYAAAHAARSRALAAMANQFGTSQTLRPLYDDAIAAARRAVGLAPRLADAQSALGYALFNGRMDVRGAREPYERSRVLGEGDADVLIRYALYAARTGDDQAAAQAIARATALDPLNHRAHRAAGNVLYAARRPADSIPPLRQALRLNPTFNSAHAAIGDALLSLGKPAEARTEYLAEPLAMFRLTGLAIVERKLGEAGAADKAMAQLVAFQGDNALYQQAQVLSQWGRKEAALDALERARAAGDAGLIYLRNDPMLDSLRGESRFKRLLLELGFD